MDTIKTKWQNQITSYLIRFSILSTSPWCRI